MSILSLIDKANKPKPVETVQLSSGPGKGKKQCSSCQSYCGVRCKLCPSCEYNFETKQSSLFHHSTIKELEITNENIVQWILMCSYIYYIKSSQLISNQRFDKLIEILKSEWNSINHRHKYLISENNLNTFSLFNLKEEDYPQIIRHAALRHLKAMKKFKCSIDEVVEKKLFNKVAFNEMVW